jgi:hypothetical protein
MKNDITETSPYELSPEALEYVPTIDDITMRIRQSENRLRPRIGSGHWPDRSVSVAYEETDTEIANRIKQIEEELITLRYAQRIRLERKSDKNWLGKVLGIFK